MEASLVDWISSLSAVVHVNYCLPTGISFPNIVKISTKAIPNHFDLERASLILQESERDVRNSQTPGLKRSKSAEFVSESFRDSDTLEESQNNIEFKELRQFENYLDNQAKGKAAKLKKPLVVIIDMMQIIAPLNLALLANPAKQNLIELYGLYGQPDGVSFSKPSQDPAIGMHRCDEARAQQKPPNLIRRMLQKFLNRKPQEALDEEPCIFTDIKAFCNMIEST